MSWREIGGGMFHDGGLDFGALRRTVYKCVGIELLCRFVCDVVLTIDMIFGYNDRGNPIRLGSRVLSYPKDRHNYRR